ncbi:MAG TPA: haloacid dehalogenase-like hydrolase [Candidatus Nanoarchaeia archaeon]|nr:haloacid dehalogenase-like hydrolase [Candidatus Nanoarchaeia archaeon]
MRTLDQAATFVNCVLKLRPKVAVFDCDGTLWGLDSGAEFFYWEIERGIIPADVGRWALARYDEYKAGRVDEATICGEMVTIHKGVSVELIRKAAAEFFAEHVSRRIFTEMQELTHSLDALGCELWAVSSTNNWVVAEGVRRFGISEEHVIAACVVCESGIATDRLIRVPTGPGKASAIRDLVQRRVDVAFGNSVHDAAMLDIARHPFAVNPNPDLEKLAEEKGWTIYHPK